MLIKCFSLQMSYPKESRGSVIESGTRALPENRAEPCRTQPDVPRGQGHIRTTANQKARTMPSADEAKRIAKIFASRFS